MLIMCMLGMLVSSIAHTLKDKNMEKKDKTIRLVYPQWQGGHIAAFIPEIKDTTAASQGYVLGAQLLNFLAPSSNMDVLEPSEIIPAVGVVDNGMRINEVVRVINDIAHNTNLVALTIAEPMPRTAILIRDMLSRLPMIGK